MSDLLAAFRRLCSLYNGLNLLRMNDIFKRGGTPDTSSVIVNELKLPLQGDRKFLDESIYTKALTGA